MKLSTILLFGILSLSPFTFSQDDVLYANVQSGKRKMLLGFQRGYNYLHTVDDRDGADTLIAKGVGWDRARFRRSSFGMTKSNSYFYPVYNYAIRKSLRNLRRHDYTTETYEYHHKGFFIRVKATYNSETTNAVMQIFITPEIG